MNKGGRVRVAFKVLLLVLAVACIAMPLATPMVFGDELNNAKDKLSETQSSITSKEKEVQENKKKMEALKVEIAGYEEKIYQAQSDISVLQTSLNSTKEEVKTILEDLDTIEARLTTQNGALLERLRTMYKNGDVGMLSVLLGSSSMSDLITNSEMVKRVFEADSKLIDELNNKYSEVMIKKEELVDLKEKMEDQKATLDSKKAALASDQKALEKLNQQISRDNKLLEAEIDAMKKEADALKATILKLQSSGKYAGGTMCWPAKSSSKVTSPFGYRIHPILKVNKFHTGIDIGAAYGTDILAANSGTVIASIRNTGGYGYYIMIDHGGGIVTLYAHCSKLLVSKGEKVKRGQVIALVGSTGMSTGAHLHFEVRLNGDYKQPLDYVSPGRYYYD